MLDSHALYWWVTGSSRLSKPALDVIAEETNEVLVSAASFYELGLKIRRGLIPGDLGELRDAVLQDGFTRLAVDERHAGEAAMLDWDHRDPWDRILAAQARVELCSLVSVDQVFDGIEVERVW